VTSRDRPVSSLPVTSPFHGGTPSIPAKPKTLSRQNCWVCSDLIRKLLNNVLSKVITRDETWCFQYKPGRNREACNGKHRHLQDPKILAYKITNKDNVDHFLRCQDYCSPRIHPTRRSGQPGWLYRNTILQVAVLRKKAWTLAQQLVPLSRRRSSSPSTVWQSRYSSTIYCWTGTYPVFTRYGSQLI
jgi:hypothetical protein